MGSYSPRLLDDLPINTGLRPGLAALAARLADLLPDLAPTSPVLVNGDWGSGKTSLLRAVQARVDGAALDPGEGCTVWFEAWHHEGDVGLLPALMRRVWESTPPAYRRTERALGLFARISRFAIALGVRALPVLAGAAGLAALEPLWKELTTAKLAEESGAVPLGAGAPPPDSVEELRAAFARLVAEAWGGRAPVIFIDDLDRCSPDGAVALLDALRMLLGGASGAGCRFVVALDRQVVVEAISAKFEKIRGYDGNRYLEKLFPLVVQVPQPGGAELGALVQELLFGEADDRIRVALGATLAEPSFANPRLIKRCVNRFRLVRHFERATQDDAGVAASGGSSEAAADKVLAEWIAAGERWPQLRVLIHRVDLPVLIQGLQSIATGSEKFAAGPELRVLRDEPWFGNWLRRSGLASRLAEFRAAEERLRLAGL